MNNGYIALHRKILDNPLVCKDAEYYAVWSYLLLNATHTEIKKMFAGSMLTLEPGMLITGRKKIASVFNISDSKVQRILKAFENEHQIEQQTSNQNRLIKVVKWSDYQESEQRNKQRVNNERTTSEQRVNTNNNVNKENKVNNDNKDTTSGVVQIEIIEYLNMVTSSKFSTKSKNSLEHINARITEGYTIDDFKTVIDKKAREWKGTEHEMFLRPSTLFCPSHFDEYLNQPERKKQNRSNEKFDKNIEGLKRFVSDE